MKGVYTMKRIIGLSALTTSLPLVMLGGFFFARDVHDNLGIGIVFLAFVAWLFVVALLVFEMLEKEGA